MTPTRVRAAGVSDEALVDAIHVAALFNMIVRLADSLGWDVPDLGILPRPRRGDALARVRARADLVEALDHLVLTQRHLRARIPERLGDLASGRIVHRGHLPLRA